MSYLNTIQKKISALNELKTQAELSIVGEGKDKSLLAGKENIKFFGYISKENDLIDIYDNHNITILPSYTEAHPYVIDESLARKIERIRDRIVFGLDLKRGVSGASSTSSILLPPTSSI